MYMCVCSVDERECACVYVRECVCVLCVRACVNACTCMCVCKCVCVRKRVRERLRVFLHQINNRHQKANPLAFVLVVVETEGVWCSTHYSCKSALITIIIIVVAASPSSSFASKSFRPFISFSRHTLSSHVVNLQYGFVSNLFTTFVSDTSIDLQITVFVKSTFKQSIIIQVQYWSFK